MNPTRVFLMQPFGVEHAKALHTIVKDELEKKGTFIVTRADTDTYPGSHLQERIDHYIKKADICVADLTEPRNNNVLLEVGAALALQIPVVLIATTAELVNARETREVMN